jgi:type III secretory pathway lipoprotein EscJ
MSLPQVRSARVHLAFAEADPLLPTAQLRPTASVLLRLRGETSVKATDIAELVARAVVGLDAADVTVLMTHAQSPLLPVPKPAAGSSVLVLLGSVCGLLLGAVVTLGLLLLRRRARDAQPKKTEHSLQALTGS